MSGAVLWAIALAFVAGGNFIGAFALWYGDERRAAIRHMALAVFCLLAAVGSGASA